MTLGNRLAGADVCSRRRDHPPQARPAICLRACDACAVLTVVVSIPVMRTGHSTTSSAALPCATPTRTTTWRTLAQVRLRFALASCDMMPILTQGRNGTRRNGRRVALPGQRADAAKGMALGCAVLTQTYGGTRLIIVALLRLARSLRALRSPPISFPFPRRALDLLPSSFPFSYTFPVLWLPIRIHFRPPLVLSRGKY